MSDLISREALIAALKKKENELKSLSEMIFIDEIIRIVESQPTVYDVDWVVGELADEITGSMYGDNYVDGFWNGHNAATTKAIDIVRRGKE